MRAKYGVPGEILQMQFRRVDIALFTSTSWFIWYWRQLLISLFDHWCYIHLRWSCSYPYPCLPPRLDSYDPEGSSLSLSIFLDCHWSKKIHRSKMIVWWLVLYSSQMILLKFTYLLVLIHLMQKATPYLSVISRGRQKPQRFRPVCQNVLIDKVNELKHD